MLTLEKSKKNKSVFFFYSFFCNINVFFIDTIFIIPLNIKINEKKQKIYFKSNLGIIQSDYSKNVKFFIKNNKLFLSVCLVENKKVFLKLYKKLIKIKIKGILQGFKKILLIKGLGFKFIIEENSILLKIGFSHNIIIKIPKELKIKKQINKFVFSSTDYILLLNFIYYLKSFKELNVYKEKGLLLQEEKIFIKEGKKNK
jgi:large subunit ribosomal protein L6